MSCRFRMLFGQNSTVTEPPLEPDNVDSNFVVILAALLCALICVLCLVAVARCTWIRRISGIVIVGRTYHQSPPPAANKGLKKKVLKTLPKLTYSTETMADKFSECAICLTEFVAGDEIRVLPLCGHGFHVTCIDTWFGSHYSCPCCRQILVAAPVLSCSVKRGIVVLSCPVHSCHIQSSPVSFTLATRRTNEMPLFRNGDQFFD